MILRNPARHYVDRVEIQRQMYLEERSPVNISLVDQEGEWIWVASPQGNPEFILFMGETFQQIVDQCQKYGLTYDIFD
ncbi:hypothetical protein [Brevibacillus marinus]|uniref:hypothetical protein n=1 Tax=Brevibacillus marinus TaxID=2496837 RepID=UPI000F83DDD9|nr:hypothetical protein [Brevibacillus marinus]